MLELPGDMIFNDHTYTLCIGGIFHLECLLGTINLFKRSHYRAIFEICKEHNVFVFFDRDIVNYEYNQ